MYFKPYPGRRPMIDLLQVIAPIFRIDLASGKPQLIGTGFWITEVGHLVTARHVVDENLVGAEDRGPIFAVQTFEDRSTAVRNFVQSDLHPVLDLALTKTAASPGNPERPTRPVTMSIDVFDLGDEVFSFAVLSDAKVFENEASPGITTARFKGRLHCAELAITSDVGFAVRLSFGNITEIFHKRRDATIYPYPCVQSNVPIYGGNSGGPLFDMRGCVRAVSASSYEGTDISFHIPVYCALVLQTSSASMGMEDSAEPRWSIGELGASQRLKFSPPLLDLHRPLRSVGVWLKYVSGCLARLERPSGQIEIISGPALETLRGRGR